MAAEKKPAEPAEGEGQPPKKKKLLLFIIAGVVGVVIAAGAAFMLLKKPPPEDGDEEEDPPAKSQHAKKKSDKGHDAPPAFVKLDPFTVKLQVEQQEAYLQTTPELRVSEPLVAERVKQFNAEIRHKVMLVLMSRKASELANPIGVQKLANELRYEVNLIIDGPKVTKKKKKGSKAAAEEEAPTAIPDHADPDDSVQAVLFTQFIIQ
jgi:flagellar FliL protein